MSKDIVVVVLEGTGGPQSNIAGLRTIREFDSKEAFESWLEGYKGDTIIAQGISREDAQQLCAETSIEARVRFVEHELKENPDSAQMTFHKVLWSAQHDRKLKPLLIALREAYPDNADLTHAQSMLLLSQPAIIFDDAFIAFGSNEDDKDVERLMDDLMALFEL